MEKRSIFTIIFLVILGIIIFAGKPICIQLGVCAPDRGKPITLVVWNLWDDENSWRDMIVAYEASVASDVTRPPVNIVYYKKVLSGSEKYEDEFSNALIQGNGPDIITLNNSWLPRYKNKLYPLDEGVKTAQSFQRKFVDVVSFDFLEGSKIYAVPLSLDSLALYYNVDILNSVGIFDPPRTWNEFNEAVRKLTIRDEQGTIKRAGAAIGTDKNINRSSDILSLLLLQSGSTITDESQGLATFTSYIEGATTKEEGKRTVGGTALQFYTDFANPNKTVYTWNPLMDYSIDAFYQMNAAMMFNYAYTIPTIRSKAPKLKFKIAPMPQITGVTIPVNYANYWAMAVSADSAHPKEAWDFLMYITNPEIAKKYLAKTSKPAAQRDLVGWQESGQDLDLAVFARQSLTAKSWYQKDNFAVETIFNDAINSVVLGRSTPEDASEIAASQLNRVMKE